MKYFIFLLFLSFNVFGKDEASKKEMTWAFAIPNKSAISAKTNILSEKHPMMRLFMNELHDFNQMIMEATITRIEIDMRNKRLICYPGSSEYSRRREFTYLTSQYIQPAPQLVVSKELGDKLLAKYNGKISLAVLMKDTTVKGSLAEGRSYGESIDRILKESEGNIIRQVYTTPIQTGIEQIKNGRIDYTLEYPFFVQYMNEMKPEANLKVVTIPLNDVEPYVTQYTACAKTSEGLEIIKRIDKVIMKNVANPDYWKEVLNSVPEQDKEEFKKNMKKFMKDRQHNSVVIQ